MGQRVPSGVKGSMGWLSCSNGELFVLPAPCGVYGGSMGSKQIQAGPRRTRGFKRGPRDPNGAKRFQKRIKGSKLGPRGYM